MPHIAVRIVTEQCFAGSRGMYPCRLSAAGTLLWNQHIYIESTTVKIVLYMWDNHIPLAYKDAVARHQLQIFNKG